MYKENTIAGKIEKINKAKYKAYKECSDEKLEACYNEYIEKMRKAEDDGTEVYATYCANELLLITQAIWNRFPEKNMVFGPFPTNEDIQEYFRRAKVYKDDGIPLNSPVSTLDMLEKQLFKQIRHTLCSSGYNVESNEFADYTVMFVQEDGIYSGIKEKVLTFKLHINQIDKEQ